MIRYKLFFLLFLSIGFFTGPILGQTCSATEASSTETLCISAILSNITHTTTGATGIGAATNLPAGLTASWAANVITISGTPSVSGTFNYSIPLTDSCGSLNATGTITVKPNNTITLSSTAGTNAQTLCINSALADITYTTTGATGASVTGLPSGVTGAWVSNVFTISGTPTASGTFNYTVTMTEGCSGGTNTATGIITVKPYNTITLSSTAGTNAQTLCISSALADITYTTTGATGASVTGLPSGVTGAWVSNVFTISGTPTSSGTFNYTVTMTGGCSGGTNTATGTITVLPSPVVIAGNNDSITCAQNVNGVSLGMSPNIGIQYYWSPINGLFTSNSSSTIANPISTTNYTLTAYNPQNGCFSYDAVLVTVNNSVPLASAGNDGLITCITNPSGLLIGTTAVAGNTYSWSPSTGLTSATAANPIANPTATTTYTLTATNTASGCIATDQVLVTVNNAVPLAYAGIDLTISCNQNVNGAVIGNLPEAGLQYSWLPTSGLSNTNSSQTNAMPLTNIAYSLSAYNPVNGCTATDQVLVTVNNSVPLASAGNDGLITCNTNPSGLLIGMTAVAGNTYSWSPTTNLTSSLAASTTANPSATNTYTLTATNTASGCTATDQVIVTVNNSVPIANAGADFTKTCTLNPNGATIGTTAISGNTYSWSPSTGLTSSSSANPIANPTATSTYTLTTTNSSNGCTATDQVIVTVNNSLPTVNAGTNDTICNGSSIALSGASNANNIVWTPSSLVSNPGSLTPSANIQGNTTFTLTATGLNGCTNSDFVIITVNDLPQSGLTNNYEICTNNNLQLNVSPNLTCQWNGLLNSTLNSINQIVDSSGTIILEITDNNNCSTTEEITINLLPIPYPIITGAGQLCQNSYWEEYSVPSTSNYIQWSIINGEFLSPNNSNTVFVHWLNGNSGQILVTETIAATGCNNEYFINVLLDASLALDTTEILMLSSNVLYTTEDYSFMNWGYESIVTHIPVSVGVYSQYCNYNNIDLSSYYYWVEIGNGNGCITKSYFNYPTFTANIENQSIDEFIVFPNPTDDIITIKTNFDSSGYQLQSINGSVVKSGIGNHEFSINIIDLPSGVYFLNLDNGNRNYRTKILKL